MNEKNKNKKKKVKHLKMARMSGNLNDIRMFISKPLLVQLFLFNVCISLIQLIMYIETNVYVFDNILCASHLYLHTYIYAHSIIYVYLFYKRRLPKKRTN